MSAISLSNASTLLARMETITQEGIHDGPEALAISAEADAINLSTEECDIIERDVAALEPSLSPDISRAMAPTSALTAEYDTPER